MSALAGNRPNTMRSANRSATAASGWTKRCRFCARAGATSGSTSPATTTTSRRWVWNRNRRKVRGLPIWVGGHSPAALRRVGQYGDGWLAALVNNKERVATEMQTIREHAQRFGRDANALQFQTMLAPPPRENDDGKGKGFYRRPRSRCAPRRRDRRARFRLGVAERHQPVSIGRANGCGDGRRIRCAARSAAPGSGLTLPRMARLLQFIFVVCLIALPVAWLKTDTLPKVLSFSHALAAEPRQTGHREAAASMSKSAASTIASNRRITTHSTAWWCRIGSTTAITCCTECGTTISTSRTCASCGATTPGASICTRSISQRRIHVHVPVRAATRNGARFGSTRSRTTICSRPIRRCVRGSSNVAVGDQIHFEGYLASYSNASGFHRGTSTTRTRHRQRGVRDGVRHRIRHRRSGAARLA